MKNRYEIKEDYVVIFLNRKDGSVTETIISLEDLERVKEFPYSWYANSSKDSRFIYIKGVCPTLAKSKVFLHRWIMNVEDSKLVVDHISHNTLDNRRSNLRVLTNSENMQNRKRLNANNKSGYMGVSFNSRKNKWLSQVILNGKTLFLGYYDDAETASKVASRVRVVLMPYSNDPKDLIDLK